MRITWSPDKYANDQGCQTGVTKNDLVVFTLAPPTRARNKYWQLRIMTFFNRSLHFTSEEGAKKEAVEMLNGKSKLKLY